MTGPRTRRLQRERALAELGYSSYPAYLRSSQWARTRARYRASREPQDCICGEVDNTQLHHMTYERVGREHLTDLTPLCPNCHAMIHVLVNRGDIGLDFAGLVNEARAGRHQVEWDRRRLRQQDEKHEEVEELVEACNRLRDLLGEYAVDLVITREAWQIRGRIDRLLKKLNARGYHKAVR